MGLEKKYLLICKGEERGDEELREERLDLGETLGININKIINFFKKVDKHMDLPNPP